MTVVSRRWIRGGDAGALDTLGIMCELVNNSLYNPVVVGAARELVTRAAPSRDQYRQAIQIRAWLSRVFDYVDDPTREELLRDPDNMLRDYFNRGRIAGDCDEAAILGAALGKSVGMGATFTVLAFDPSDGGSGEFSHVFATLLTDDGQEVSLDVTKPAGSVPAPIRAATLEV